MTKAPGVSCQSQVEARLQDARVSPALNKRHRARELGKEGFDVGHASRRAGTLKQVLVLTSVSGGIVTLQN